MTMKTSSRSEVCAQGILGSALVQEFGLRVSTEDRAGRSGSKLNRLAEGVAGHRRCNDQAPRTSDREVQRPPETEQNRAAELLLGFADSGQARYRLTDEQLAEVERARQEAREGEFASDEEMAALWRRFGL
jgi:hypothetical protein